MEMRSVLDSASKAWVTTDDCGRPSRFRVMRTPLGCWVNSSSRAGSMVVLADMLLLGSADGPPDHANVLRPRGHARSVVVHLVGRSSTDPGERWWEHPARP